MHTMELFLSYTSARFRNLELILQTGNLGCGVIDIDCCVHTYHIGAFMRFD